MNELKMSLNQGSCQQSRSRSGSKLVLLPGCDLVFQGVCIYSERSCFYIIYSGFIVL